MGNKKMCLMGGGVELEKSVQCINYFGISSQTNWLSFGFHNVQAIGAPNHTLSYTDRKLYVFSQLKLFK